MNYINCVISFDRNFAVYDKHVFTETLKPVLNRVVVELFPVGGQGHFRAHGYKTADCHSFTRNMSSSTWVPVSNVLLYYIHRSRALESQ